MAHVVLDHCETPLHHAMPPSARCAPPPPSPRATLPALALPRAQVTSLVLSDDDLLLYSSARDKSFICWDLRNEKRLAGRSQHSGAINALVLLPAPTPEARAAASSPPARVCAGTDRPHHTRPAASATCPCLTLHDCCSRLSRTHAGPTSLR